MTNTQRKLFIFTLLAGTFTMSISQSTLSTAYPTLMKAFGISTETVAWLTTGFMLMMCIMMPISPWLLNNISFKRLFLTAVGTFEVGTLLIIIAPNFPLVMVGRLLEAAAVGFLFPSFQAVLLTITPVEMRPAVMGTAGLVMGSALACGPIISGIILNYVSWQGLFMFFFVVLAVVFISALFNMRDVMDRDVYALDWVSIFLSVGLVLFLYCINALSNGQETSLTWGLFVVSLVLSALFVTRQFKLDKPLLQLRTLGNMNFVFGVLLTGFSYMTLIVTTVVTPLFYQGILKTSVLVSGLALVLPAASLSILNKVSGRLARTIGFKPVLVGGMVLITVGWAGWLLTLKDLNIWGMIGWAIVLEGGNAFVMMPATTLGANALPKHLIADGTAITTTARQLLGSLGVMIAMYALQFNGQSSLTIGGYYQVAAFFFVLELVGLGLACLIKSAKA